MCGMLLGRAGRRRIRYVTRDAIALPSALWLIAFGASGVNFARASSADLLNRFASFCGSNDCDP